MSTSCIFLGKHDPSTYKSTPDWGWRKKKAPYCDWGTREVISYHQIQLIYIFRAVIKFYGPLITWAWNQDCSLTFRPSKYLQDRIYILHTLLSIHFYGVDEQNLFDAVKTFFISFFLTTLWLIELWPVLQ